MKSKRAMEILDVNDVPDEELDRLELADSVRGLRKHLGQSQQAFATALGLSVRAVANYESQGRIPEARVLAILAKNAADAGFPDIANNFLREIGINLRLGDIRGGSILSWNLQPAGGYMLIPLKDEQAYQYAAAFIRAFDAALSNDESRNGPAKSALENFMMDAKKIPHSRLFKRDFKSKLGGNR